LTKFRIAVDEVDSLRGQGVDVRRGNGSTGHAAAAKGQVVPAEIVGQDQHDVRGTIGGFSTFRVGARLPLDGDIGSDGHHAWHGELDDRKDHVGTVGPDEGSKKRQPHGHSQADFRDLAHRSLPLGFRIPKS
jgi:hypothetical protein